MMETLEQERRMHRMTIEMGNLCGAPISEPGNGRASSLWRSVNCPACIRIGIARNMTDSAGGKPLVRGRSAS